MHTHCFAARSKIYLELFHLSSGSILCWCLFSLPPKTAHCPCLIPFSYCLIKKQDQFHCSYFVDDYVLCRFQTYHGFGLLATLLQALIFLNIFADLDSNAGICHLFSSEIFIFCLPLKNFFNFCFFLARFLYFLYFRSVKLFGLNFRNLNFEI